MFLTFAIKGVMTNPQLFCFTYLFFFISYKADLLHDNNELKFTLDGHIRSTQTWKFNSWFGTILPSVDAANMFQLSGSKGTKQLKNWFRGVWFWGVKIQGVKIQELILRGLNPSVDQKLCSLPPQNSHASLRAPRINLDMIQMFKY